MTSQVIWTAPGPRVTVETDRVISMCAASSPEKRGVGARIACGHSTLARVRMNVARAAELSRGRSSCAWGPSLSSKARSTGDGKSAPEAMRVPVSESVEVLIFIHGRNF